MTSAFSRLFAKSDVARTRSRQKRCDGTSGPWWRLRRIATSSSTRPSWSGRCRGRCVRGQHTESERRRRARPPRSSHGCPLSTRSSRPRDRGDKSLPLSVLDRTTRRRRAEAGQPADGLRSGFDRHRRGDPNPARRLCSLRRVDTPSRSRMSGVAPASLPTAGTTPEPNAEYQASSGRRRVQRRQPMVRRSASRERTPTPPDQQGRSSAR